MPVTFGSVATSFDYRRQALTYDSTRAASPSVVRPLRQALALAGPSEVALLLDVGGGTGNYAQAMVDHGWPVVVVDRSPDMSRVAGAKGLPVALADACALPIVDASSGAVMLVSMLHHVPDWKAALSEARRAVRPGGVVAVMAFAREHLAVHLIEDYFPTALAHFRPLHPSLADLRSALPGALEIPVYYEDTVDGSLAALCRHPELLLDPAIRRQTSFFEWAEDNTPDELARGLERLACQLSAGQRPQDRVVDVRSRCGDAVVMAWIHPTERPSDRWAAPS